jgi:hypothetical protein
MSQVSSARAVQRPLFYEVQPAVESGGAPPEVETRTQNARLMPSVSAAGHTAGGVSQPKIGPGVSYQRQSGELYAKGGPRAEDIQQGGLGDCYFLASLTAVVADNPEAVRDAIRNNHDGTYSVRFYDEGRREVWVTVSRNLPVDAAGNLLYARAKDRDGDNKMELWVPLMEKAYAAFKDLYGPLDPFKGYEDIGRGGWASDAMQALTGRAVRTEWMPSSAELLTAVSFANTGADVVLDTKDSPKAGWVASHSYTVLGVYIKDGETMVRLRNPWGFGEPDGALADAENDGIFDVTIEELDAPYRPRKLFD